LRKEKKIKVNQSHYRPGDVVRFPGGQVYQISRQLAHEGGNVVSTTHQPSLPPENEEKIQYHYYYYYYY
jgi:hypothetical protein